MIDMAEAASSDEREDRERFTDVSSEPHKQFPPLPTILRLDSKTTSSLCEVVKPICHLIEDLPNRVTHSLEQCQNPQDGLTIDESAAIHLYTQQWPKGQISFYTMFNRVLRDENRTKLIPFHQYLHLFMTALNKLPPLSDRVWRGETGDWGSQCEPGTIHVWWGVSSCTDMIRITGNFLDDTQKRTLFNIKCKNGKIIKNHSQYPVESETVLPPATHLKVKSSLNLTPDICIVDLEEISPTSQESAELEANDTISDTILNSSQIDSIYIVWIDPNVSGSEESKKTQEKLKELFPDRFCLFEKSNEGINHLQANENQQFLLITGGQTGKDIISKVNGLVQIEFIIIYCMNKQVHQQWSRHYEKIIAVVVEADELIETIQELDNNVTETRESSASENVGEHNNILSNITTNEIEQDLQTLNDIMNESLVSLKKSLQPIERIIPDLQTHINIALETCLYPADGLTQDESAAIYIYSMEWDAYEACLYRLLNQDLLTINRDILKKWFPYLRLLLQALNKLPTYKGTVWRGVRRNLTDTYQVGASYTWYKFSSATSAMSVLESDLYLGQQGTRTLFCIECTNGKSIQHHSQFQAENEIVLLPGFHFEVTNKFTAGNDLHIITIKEIASSVNKKYSKQTCHKKIGSFFTKHFHKYK